MKEFGGYISLEKYGDEYFDYIDQKKVLRLNSARSAIVLAFVDSGCSKLWLPIYLCRSVTDALIRSNIEFDYYNIDHLMRPNIEKILENECILITNFYGLQSEEFYHAMEVKYKNIIFDNTQSFYASPIFREDCYNVYSARKFFGVSDGAYLIGTFFNNKYFMKKDSSSERMLFLLKSKESGTNQAYGDYLASEENISTCDILEMSDITQTLLGNVNYKQVQNKRVDNFLYMDSLLQPLEINRFQCEKLTTQVPMIYPLLLEREQGFFRKYLIDNRIYVPQWWKWILSETRANKWEKSLAEGLLPLPIDQRYSHDDIDDIVKIIKKYRRV